MISVFIISAPSGSGKSTLVHRLLKAVPGLTFSISYTTRPPRPSETNGVDYIFISRAEFPVRLSQGEFPRICRVFSAIITVPTAAPSKRPSRRAKTWYSTSTYKVRDN